MGEKSKLEEAIATVTEQWRGKGNSVGKREREALRYADEIRYVPDQTKATIIDAYRINAASMDGLTITTSISAVAEEAELFRAIIVSYNGTVVRTAWH